LKYIRLDDDGEIKDYFFDLADDVSEQNNLILSRTGDVEQLKTLLAAWEEDVRPVR
jgi:hypothetical protein